MQYSIPHPRPPTLAATLVMLLIPSVAATQVIPVRTVPIATGDQFGIFPSQNLGMGSISIALDDALLDPFVNPAKGSRLMGAQVFLAPSLFDVSGETGAGRTLPVGATFGSNKWFGGFTLSIQQLEREDIVPPLFIGPGPTPASTLRPLSEKSSNNLYAFGMLGTKLTGTGISLGASIYWAGLNAVSGVDMLYPNSLSIEQSGHALDIRVGMLAELEGEATIEALLLHSRIDMTHDVERINVFALELDSPPLPVVLNETNLDRTNTWGLHMGYVRPLAQNGWRVGGILTMNIKDHPKIPNYELMNIPRDPGTTAAFNIGAGISRTVGPARYGLDVVYEPIWSQTWAEAEFRLLTQDGGIIEPGQKTVENDFRFSNALVRMGVGYETDAAGFQLGLQVRSIDYTLEQEDHIQNIARDQTENWLEWTPSWGGVLKFQEVQVRYAGFVTTGTGRVGVFSPPPVAVGAFTTEDNFLIAPEGPLTLQEASVITHQLTVSLPIH